MTQTLTDESLAEFTLPDMEAPSDYNPDSAGYRDAPVGHHRMTVTGFEVFPDHEFRADGQAFILDQLRPKFAISKGQPHEGATIMDFLPMPTQGRPMPTLLANRWGQFIKRLGFEIPPGKLNPVNFRLIDIKGKECIVAVEHSTDTNGNPKFKKNGEPQHGVKFFGYDYIGAQGAATVTAASGSGGKTAPGNAAPRGSARQPSTPATDPKDFDI